MKRKGIAVLVMAVLLLGACSEDSCRAYSQFTCAQLEEQSYNVYYYDTPVERSEQQEQLIGQVTGLVACGSLANQTAESRKDARTGDWSYVCCLQTDQSPCLEKHR